MVKTTKGSCLCGGIDFDLRGDLRSVIACHCNQCRKTSGHHVAATRCRSEDLAVNGDCLVWYKSSDKAERGFCGTCGSSLFWRPFGSEYTSVFAGALDNPDGLKMVGQIHTEAKGTYYDLPAVPDLGDISQQKS